MHKRLTAITMLILLAMVGSLLFGTTPVLSQEEELDDAADNPAVPPEIEDNLDDWTLANKDYNNTRRASNSQINADNVGDLGIAWEFAIPGSAAYGAAASTPLIIDGVVYFQDLMSNVFALDFETGEVIWEAMYDMENYGPNGPAVGWDKVFVPIGVDSIAALRKSDGEELWSVRLTAEPTEGIDIQPMIYNDLVFVSTVPGTSDANWYTGGVTGILYALDQETGEIVWEWDSVDSEDIWGNPEVNSGGGVWFPPAVDVETGITYWSIANPAPWPGTDEFPNGSSRPGPNLYTNSLVAIDNATGELLWHQQVYPHDLFDLDLHLSPILTTAVVQGEQRDIVITSGKLGEVFAMDRATGEVLWRAVVGDHMNTRLQEIPYDTVIKVLPGPLGGVETPMAISEDGIIFVPIVNLPAYYSPTEFILDRWNLADGTGEFAAVDAGTGAVLWAHEFDSMNFGGATVSNDLVFTATYDGTNYAFNHDGEIVWQWQSESGINGWSAIVDDTILIPAGVGSNPRLIALRLGAGDPVGQMGDNQTDQAGDDQGEGQVQGGGEGDDAEDTDSADSEQSDDEGEGQVQGGGEGDDAEATEEAPDQDQQATPTPAGESGDQGADADQQDQAGDQADGSQFIELGEEDQTVHLTVIASLDGTNGGLNFNGYASGNATYRIPEGWTVHVTFTNESELPHSAMVTAPEATDETTPTELAFEGAQTPDPDQGITAGQTVEFTFTAGEQGEYAMLCGVPTHAQQGQWIWFEVVGSDQQPAWITDDQEYVPGSSSANGAATPAVSPTPTAADQTDDATDQADATPTPADEQDSGQNDGQDATVAVPASEFISIDADNQTVTLNIIATYDETNDGFNFNGYASGGATYRVPQGWTVQVNFQNLSTLYPHSVVIAGADVMDNAYVGQPVFEGASTENPLAGTVSEIQEFTFTAEQQGRLVIADGVHGNTQQGMWIWLEIGAADVQPTFEPTPTDES